MQAIDDELERWTRAGLLDAPTAERIRLFEASREHPAGLRWQVLLALIFGAILLAAGVTLFVAAHWDELSPIARFAVVMGMLVVLHVGALLVRPHFERLAIVLHGVGRSALVGAMRPGGMGLAARSGTADHQSAFGAGVAGLRVVGPHRWLSWL
jgi:hypothetical protein